ncbi:MAG TPA: VOC family protein [Flavobacterium sp.]|nr:VOC family protein [Flavobacterium sp.]
MKPSILGLRTVIYKVNDITAAKTFYISLFETEPYFDEPFYVGFNIAGYELGLHPGDENPQDKIESALTYWGVNDVEAEYKRMLGLGAKPHEQPTNVGGEIIVASVKDPWGNIIGLIYNPEFRLP